MPNCDFSDVKKAIELYNKYKSMNRAALSFGCSATKFKKILVENGVEIKKHKPPKLNMHFRNTRMGGKK